MGLDMYLSKRTYVGAKYAHNKIEGEVNLKKEGKKLNIKTERISYIIEEVAYWRKANAIHNWFVKNIQDGEDNCEDYWVGMEKIEDLIKCCEEVLKNNNLADDLLPTIKGFFFGGTEYDEWYFKDLEYTIDTLKPLLEEGGDFYYQSSW